MSRLSNSKMLHLVFLSGFVILVAYWITGNTFIYGADVDWVNQHSVLPDYFRQHFYETGDLFPEFAPDLGAGQNIYYFAYHGFLSPVILFSYLLPWVDMVDYVICANIFMVLCSVWLFYWWMLKKGFTPRMALITSWFFTCASPLIYHSHKQVMFVQYMPFLILAYMGVDRLYRVKKRGLLAVSVALMFLTSYFFSVSALFALTFYAIYKYIGTTEKPGLRTFCRAAASYAYSILTGIFLAGILLLPTLYALLAGRGDNAGKEQSFLALLIPQFPFTAISYSAYGIGVMSIGFFAILYFLLHRQKAGSKFMAVSILLFTCLPLFLYMLNGFLYVREKALIPFLPLVCYMIGCFCCEIRDGLVKLKPYVIAYPVLTLLMTFSFQYKFKWILGFVVDFGLCLLLIWLAQHFKKSWLFFLPYGLAAMCICITANFSTGLLKKETANYIHSPEKISLIQDTLSKDSSFYRSGDMSAPKATNNMDYGSRFYSTGFYSSAYNRYYRDFCYTDLQIANPTVNPISVTIPNDALFQRFMGVKYLLSDYGAPAGYTPCGQKSYFTIYRNDEVYSIGFGGHELMSLREYETLSPADKEFAVLRYIVVDQELPDVYTSPYEPVTLDFQMSYKQILPGQFHVELGREKSTVVVSLPTSLQQDVYVVDTVIANRPDTRACIRINKIQNVLSGKNATLPNDNFQLRYMVSSADPLDTMTIDFVGPSDYIASDFTFHRVSYDTIRKQGEHLSQMTDVCWKESNQLTGSITMNQDGYFAATIPYDEGFQILVDGKETEYEMVDHAFLGFPLNAGTHTITITFHAPLRTAGICLSILGLLMLLGTLVYQRIRLKF